MSTTPHVSRRIPGQRSLVVASTTDHADRFAWLDEGTVRLLDAGLDEVAAREVAATRLLAARGLDHLVMQRDDELIIAGVDTFVITDVVVDAAAFVGRHLVATAPGHDEHRILLLDVRTGDVLDEVPVDVEDAAAFITPHPTDPTVLIEFPMGQDGTVTRRVDVEGDTLTVSEVFAGEDVVLAGFDSMGGRLLVVPYPDDPEVARVVSWPSLDELGRLTPQNLDTEIGIGLAACWIDDDHVGLYAMEDALVVTDGALGDPQRAELPVQFGDDGDLESLTRLAPGRVAAGVWEHDGRSTLVLQF